MQKFMDPLFWYFVIIGAIWAYRARRALNALQQIPVVDPNPKSKLPNLPRVTVIIPAKNEEKNIRQCLERFQKQDYANLQIIVVNDHSTDRTESILRTMDVPEITAELAVKFKRGAPAPIGYLNPPPTPEGWTGKNFAIHSAIPFAQGDWLLFTDADTRHEFTSVSAAIDHALRRDLLYLTLLPKCLTGGLMERIIQPSAMGFLGLWFPIEKVNDPKSQSYFGNGQYLLIQRKLYERIQGHEHVRSEFLEDYAITRNVKATGARFQCALGVSVYGTRMYDSLNAMWNGWRRIYLHAFQQNPKTLLQKYLSVLFFSVLPFACFVPYLTMAFKHPERFGSGVGFAAVVSCFILITAWKTYGIVKANRLFSLLHPLAAFFISMFLLDAFWMALSKQKTIWR
ncbi:MAG: glycosyltransferase family 2 protein [Candidatus Omnitrophica bacterium]|nr:glycosyltransferase family 2 protein [Candidatus Omnitrophota bacterium]